MIKFEVDDGPYPTEESLEALRQLDAVEHGRAFLLEELPKIVEMLAPYGVYEVADCDDRGPLHIGQIEIVFHTQGWSGCEDMIDAVLTPMMRLLYLYQWRRGGHYWFRVSKFEKGTAHEEVKKAYGV